MTSSGVRQLDVVVLAAGKGTRLKSRLPKVLHPLFGRPLLQRVLEGLESLSVRHVYVVVGHGRDEVTAHLAELALPFPVTPVVQEPQLGTGHALMQARPALDQTGAEDVLVLSGDVPLLRPESLAALLERHRHGQNALTLLGARLQEPAGYGRLLCDDAGQLTGIVEEKDASDLQKAIDTVNAGIYCLDWKRVSPLLDRLTTENVQGEFYLTDLVALSRKANETCAMALLDDPRQMQGINRRSDLAEAHAILNADTLERLMAEGVSIVDPRSTFIGPEVQIGTDTVIEPGCTLVGEITVGEGCRIGAHTTVEGRVSIGDGTQVLHSWLRDVAIGPNNRIGPFAHLRDGVETGDTVRLGNFVEAKNTTIDDHTNAAHLCYLGDARLGHHVNMGAGSITANYDPIRDSKHQTLIGDEVKVGCNAVLVAPVEIGEGASVAAGSVITRNVNPEDLAIARPKQSDIKGWVRRIKGRVAAREN